MNWTASLLRNEIKKLKAGWQVREQELLTINPQAQLFLNLENKLKEQEKELKASQKSLHSQQKSY